MERMKLRTAAVWVVTLVLFGCATRSVAPPSQTLVQPAPLEARANVESAHTESGAERNDIQTGWTERVITEEEILRVTERDPELSPTACKEILARLNTKAHYYITDDIANRHPLRVPHDFRAYKAWSPMPFHISRAAHLPKLILVVLDIPFLGWYEKGELKGDTYICIGRSGQETQPGLYKVEEKDADHHSRSYTNSYNRPAWMPWAMRIYEAVWIHAGDITSAYCSHGCVTLPLKEAETLFRWANSGTPVLIVESLEKFLQEQKKIGIDTRLQ
jgi:hypothetical protein